MNIKNIETQEDNLDIFIVEFVPNWIEKIFGIKPKEKKFKKTGTYQLGGGGVYVRQNGEKLGNGHWIGKTIDRWIRKF